MVDVLIVGAGTLPLMWSFPVICWWFQSGCFLLTNPTTKLTTCQCKITTFNRTYIFELLFFPLEPLKFSMVHLKLATKGIGDSMRFRIWKTLFLYMLILGRVYVFLLISLGKTNPTFTSISYSVFYVGSTPAPRMQSWQIRSCFLFFVRDSGAPKCNPKTVLVAVANGRER